MNTRLEPETTRCDAPERRRGETPQWTAARIRALGPVTDIAAAARIFGLSRAVAYDLARRGEFPVAVLRFGSRYRVPVAAILAALHVPTTDDPAHQPAAPPPDLTGAAKARVDPPASNPEPPAAAYTEETH